MHSWYRKPGSDGKSDRERMGIATTETERNLLVSCPAQVQDTGPNAGCSGHVQGELLNMA